MQLATTWWSIGGSNPCEGKSLRDLLRNLIRFACAPLKKRFAF